MPACAYIILNFLHPPRTSRLWVVHKVRSRTNKRLCVPQMLGYVRWSSKGFIFYIYISIYLYIYISILLVSYFMWSGAIDSSDVFLPCPTLTLVLHFGIILTKTILFIYFRDSLPVGGGSVLCGTGRHGKKLPQRHTSVRFHRIRHRSRAIACGGGGIPMCLCQHRPTKFTLRENCLLSTWIEYIEGKRAGISVYQFLSLSILLILLLHY